MKTYPCFFTALLAMLWITPWCAAQNGAPSAPAAPKGFYLLNDRQVAVEKMTLPGFLSGFTLRMAWRDLETRQGVYNFELIKRTVTHLQSKNLKLTLEIFSSMPPAYVLKGAQSTFAGPKGKAPTPWDTFAQARWQALLTALAATPVRDSAAGIDVALANHPTLTAVDASVVGLQMIRDVKGDLVRHSDYNRKKFIDAVVQSISVSRQAFPQDYGFVGFFRIQDSDRSLPLEEELYSRLQAEFMNEGQPGLGLFQELWSDEGPAADGLGYFLTRQTGANAVMLQALTSWKKPFQDPLKVASGNPDGALDKSYVDFGCMYYEIYYADVNATDLRATFDAWAAFFAGQ
jgi:hypothetical protein